MPRRNSHVSNVILLNRLAGGHLPAISRWAAQLAAIKAWANPFDGLDVAELPPVPML